MIKLLMMLIPVLISCDVWAGFNPPSVEANNDGVKLYQGEDYHEAFNNFNAALAKDPFNPLYHFNLADTFLKNGEIPKALAEFEAVEANSKATPELKFQALFNAGNASIEAKDIPKALQYYQRALDYKPDSIEVKTNIELALKEEQNQGGGQGDSKDQKDKDQKNQKDKPGQENKDDKNQKKDQEQKQPNNRNGQPQPTPRPTPHGFKSQALNEGDVQRILEELKRQEEQVRAKQDKTQRKTPERQIEKDW